MKKFTSKGVLWSSNQQNMIGSVRQENINCLNKLSNNRVAGLENKHEGKENMQQSTKPKTQDYQELKDKIHNLEERIGNIKKNYDILQKNKQKKSIKSAKLISPPIFKPDLDPSFSENVQREKEIPQKTVPLSTTPKLLHQRTFHDKCRNEQKLAKKTSREQQNPKKENNELKKISFGSEKHRFDPRVGFRLQKPEKPKRYSLKADENGVNMNDYITKYTTKEVMHSSSDSSLNNMRINRKKEKYENKYYLSMVISAFKAACPSAFEQMCRDHLTASLDVLAFIHKMGKKEQACVPIPQKLPAPTRQTLIFDLDETLIHCNEQLSTPHDALLPIMFPDKKIVTVAINVRPYIYQCLKELRKYFELMVFTASHACYANVVINHIDPKGYFFTHRFFREHCHKTEEGMYVKDLRVINRDLSRVLLIDNAAYSYAFQPENGVPILPFYDNQADTELKSLTTYLKQMFGVPDVRKKNDTMFKLSQYCRYSNATELLNSLYP